MLLLQAAAPCSLCEGNPSRVAQSQAPLGEFANPLQWQQHSRELNHTAHANPHQLQCNAGQFARNEAQSAQGLHSSNRPATAMSVDARNSALLQTASGYISSASHSRRTNDF